MEESMASRLKQAMREERMGNREKEMTMREEAKRGRQKKRYKARSRNGRILWK